MPCAAALLLAVAQQSWATPPLYRVVELPLPPDAVVTQAYGVNNAGDAVGAATNAAGIHAVAWPAGAATARALGDLTPDDPTDTSIAYAINESGLVAGISPASTGYLVAVVWWPSGTIEQLADLRGGIVHCRAFDINEIGQVVGFGTRRNGALSDGSRAVRWTAAPRSIQPLGALSGGTLDSQAMAVNDAGTVVGSAAVVRGSHAFRWTVAAGMQDLGDLPGGADDSEAQAVNNQEQVVGLANSDLGQRAFVWDAAGGMQDLGAVAGGSGFVATDINDAGQAVGQFTRSGTDVHSFYWTAADGMVDVADLIEPSDPQKTRVAASMRVSQINDQGVIVGTILAPPVRAVLLIPVK